MTSFLKEADKKLQKLQQTSETLSEGVFQFSKALSMMPLRNPGFSAEISLPMHSPTHANEGYFQVSQLTKLLIYEKKYDGDPGTAFEWPDQGTLTNMQSTGLPIKLKQVDCAWPRG